MLTLEVVPLPVTDVDRACAFYTEQVGFILDVDYRPTPDFRVVQLTHPGPRVRCTWSRLTRVAACTSQCLSAEELGLIAVRDAPTGSSSIVPFDQAVSRTR